MNTFHAVIIEGGTQEMRAACATEIFKERFAEDESAASKLDEGIFEDLVTVEAEEGKAFIMVRQIEDLIKAFARKPFASVARAAIIVDGERMNEAAQNKLLKLLEEPPSGYIIAILTANAEKLLPTVRSRCVRRWLGYGNASQSGDSNDDARQLARILIYDRGALAEANALLAKYESARDEAVAFLRVFQMFLRDLAVGKYAPSLSCDAQLAETAAKVEPEHSLRMREGVLLAENAIRDIENGYNIKYTLRGIAVSMRNNRR